MIVRILCQAKNRERSIVSLCEHLGYCRLVQNLPIRTILPLHTTRNLNNLAANVGGHIACKEECDICDLIGCTHTTK